MKNMTNMTHVFTSVCAAYAFVMFQRHYVTSQGVLQAEFVKSWPPLAYEDRDALTLANIDARSPMHCAVACIRTGGCQSYMYKETDSPQEHCFTEATAQQFNGTRNVVYSGETCRLWDTPHKWRTDISDSASFPEGSVPVAENYCRDPRGDGFLWCAMEDAHQYDWETCNMPRCMQTNCRLFSDRFVVYPDRVQMTDNTDIVFYQSQ